MCGICGIWYFNPQHTVDQSLLSAMTDSLHHRGPDASEIFIDGSIGLGVRRLAIVDKAGSDQPLYSEDCRITLVANGEIYNHAQLRRSNHQYRTSGDMECIIHLYEDYGKECAQHLRGMFAFALWDSRLQRLTIAVDRFGEKPLYMTRNRDRVAFASELKALRCLPDFDDSIDSIALDEYLACGYIVPPRSIYRNVRKISPGHSVTFQRDGTEETQQYWSPQFAPTGTWKRRTMRDAAEEVRHVLEESVKMRLMGDETPGAFLSGGIDSSSVTGLMSRMTSQPIKTYSVGFKTAAYDETVYARSASATFRTNHTVIQVDEHSLEYLPALVRQFDEPFADSSMLTTYLVSCKARENVRSVLSGDGGDELFGGYHQHLYAYRQYYLESLLGHASPLAARASARIPAFTRLKPYVAAINQPSQRWLTNGFFTAAQRQRLYGSQAQHALISQFDEARDALFNSITHLDRLSQLQYHDIVRYLAGDILVKVDRASMLASLEVRAPFLDHVLFELVASLPPGLRSGLWRSKRLLKQAMGSALPADIRNRRKQGFSIPQAEWLRTTLAPQVWELPNSPALTSWFDARYIRALVTEHMSKQVDHKDRLWALLCLHLWAQT